MVKMTREEIEAWEKRNKRPYVNAPPSDGFRERHFKKHGTHIKSPLRTKEKVTMNDRLYYRWTDGSLRRADSK
jgi:hypothetical protein